MLIRNLHLPCIPIPLCFLALHTNNIHACYANKHTFQLCKQTYMPAMQTNIHACYINKHNCRLTAVCQQEQSKVHCIYGHEYIYIYIYVCMYTYAHVYIFMYTQTLAQTHTHILHQNAGTDSVEHRHRHIHKTSYSSEASCNA
jgi:hypothetical protein